VKERALMQVSTVAGDVDEIAGLRIPRGGIG
jgi:hypothetical protein